MDRTRDKEQDRAAAEKAATEAFAAAGMAAAEALILTETAAAARKLVAAQNIAQGQADLTDLMRRNAVMASRAVEAR